MAGKPRSTHPATAPTYKSLHPLTIQLSFLVTSSSILQLVQHSHFQLHQPLPPTTSPFHFGNHPLPKLKMPAKAAEKKPTTGGKAPAGKAPAEKKEAGKKAPTAPSGEKKKRGKTRKETYSSYIYKGMSDFKL